MIYNRNHRTAWGRGLSTLRLCFLTEDNVTGGVGSQREGLSGVSSLTLALNSLMALWRWGLRTKFSGTFIRARPLANTDHPTGSNPFRWRNVSLTRSTTWEPGIGLFSYNSSPLSVQCNTSWRLEHHHANNGNSNSCLSVLFSGEKYFEEWK